MNSLSEFRYTPAELQVQVSQQDAEFAVLLGRKRPGARALIGRGNRHSGQVTILVGSGGDWNRGMVCYGQDSRRRAERYVERYNRAA